MEITKVEPNARLAQRREQALKVNEAARAKRSERGMLLARERVAKLVDADSFIELDRYSMHNCNDFGLDEKRVEGDGVVTGQALIDGRPVYLFAHDATYLGGSLGEVFARKVCKVMDLAKQAGCPVIGLNESAGARIQEGVSSLAGYADIFYRNVFCSGVIPQISIIYGPCAGGAVYSPAVTDFTIMVKNHSYMFITGPEIVKTVTGEEVTFEELGGALVHNEKSGVAQLLADDEEDSFYLVRTLLSYLPSNNLETPPYTVSDEEESRPEDIKGLDTLVPADPAKPYDMNDVVARVFDNGDFFEIAPYWARNIVTGFARLKGHAVGVVANQPKWLAGVLDIDASAKGARFIRFCDAFNIPIVTFVDVPGYLPGKNQEHMGIIRHGAKLLYAYCEASVPKLTVITRKAYGGAFDVMGSKNVGGDLNLAWPTAEVAVMGADGAVNLLYRKEIAGPGGAERAKQLVQEYRQRFANPYVAAERGYIDDVIMPSETRTVLTAFLDVQQNKRIERPARKHGNIPL
jgi:acetyl-CoA carboxylase carboxyltransferase component